MTLPYEDDVAFSRRLDDLISQGKLKAEHKILHLEIAELSSKATKLRLISGLGWGVDAQENIIDEYEIGDKDGNFIYLSLRETIYYLQNLLKQNTTNS